MNKPTRRLQRCLLSVCRYALFQMMGDWQFEDPGGEAFEYPAGVEEQVRRAIEHHVTSNRHHYQFHGDPNDMTEVDLIEMVCDWTAMSQEFGQDGGSARGWPTRRSAAAWSLTPIGPRLSAR